MENFRDVSCVFVWHVVKMGRTVQDALPEMLPIKDCFYILRRARISRGARDRKRLNASLSGVYDNLCRQNCRLAIYRVKHIRAVDFLSFSSLLLIGSYSQELTCNDFKEKKEILTR